MPKLTVAMIALTTGFASALTSGAPTKTQPGFQGIHAVQIRHASKRKQRQQDNFEITVEVTAIKPNDEKSESSFGCDRLRLLGSPLANLVAKKKGQGGS